MADEYVTTKKTVLLKDVLTNLFDLKDNVEWPGDDLVSDLPRKDFIPITITVQSRLDNKLIEGSESFVIYVHKCAYEEPHKLHSSTAAATAIEESKTDNKMHFVPDKDE